MRVIAGSARSLILKTPAGDTTRPTSDRIKETLFNILMNDIPDSVFVDLCSGSGQIGIEALSRGAGKAYFIDNDSTAIGCIDANLKHTKMMDKSVVLKQDAVTSLSYGIRERADIIFADPPYGKGIDEQILAAAAGSKAVDKDTLIIVEELKDRDFAFANDLGFDIIREKIYKTNKHVFLRKA
ncbi:MAG: 16S rRNA (guanine(966)-N(2))-methyltransferase RsmD [Lachnospiraceae bacterium]|nr:16S rRNA (guanine(966)-N(2))-methyltransferase RsmD [Lachnospiraceae bacterium]